MAVHIAIVEDDEKAREILESYFERFSQENHVVFEVDSYTDPVLLLERYQPIYDIIYMDIQMPNMNGMEAAHRLRALDQKVLLVFVTSLTQYAIAGYEVAALDYIVKPVQYYSFAMKLTKALWKIDRSDEDAISIATGTSTARVNLRDIKYIDIQDHLLTYYTADGTYLALGTMSKLEKELIDKGFARCSSSCLVNLKYAKSVKGYVLTLEDGTELRISQPRKKGFLKTMETYQNARHI